MNYPGLDTIDSIQIKLRQTLREGSSEQITLDNFLASMVPCCITDQVRQLKNRLNTMSQGHSYSPLNNNAKLTPRFPNIP